MYTFKNIYSCHYNEADAYSSIELERDAKSI